MKRNQPFCQPFGNRRLLHCKPSSHDTKAKQAGEVPAWEACGKVVAKERQDFWEFVVRPPLHRLCQWPVIRSRLIGLDVQSFVSHCGSRDTLGKDIGIGNRAIQAARRADRYTRQRLARLAGRDMVVCIYAGLLSLSTTSASIARVIADDGSPTRPPVQFRLRGLEVVGRFDICPISGLVSPYLGRLQQLVTGSQ